LTGRSLVSATKQETEKAQHETHNH
jgi:hypothetical protein